MSHSCFNWSTLSDVIFMNNMLYKSMGNQCFDKLLTGICTWPDMPYGRIEKQLSMSCALHT